VDEKTNARVASDLDDPLALIERRRQRLLADDVNTALGRELDGLKMSLGRGDDVDEVGLEFIEQLRQVPPTCSARDAVCLGHFAGFLLVAVRDR
jgi:hypothetical protein